MPLNVTKSVCNAYFSVKVSKDIKKMVHAWRASIELWMHAGSWESRGEAFEWHEAKPAGRAFVSS